MTVDTTSLESLVTRFVRNEELSTDELERLYANRRVVDLTEDQLWDLFEDAHRAGVDVSTPH